MSSRRTFIKYLLGLGAFLVPWALRPASGLGSALEALTGTPKAKLIVPPEVPPVQRPEWPDGGPDAAYILDTIQTLSAKEMEGRRAGTRGETIAAAYLESVLLYLSLKPMGTSQYLQPFPIPPMEEVLLGGRRLFRPASQGLRGTASNILGALPGDQADRYIVISAHYDHLGLHQGELCLGANDNASGVAAVVHVLNRLTAEKVKLRKTVLAAFWGAEEMGYLGSKHFVEHPTVPIKQIDALLNLDSVGLASDGDIPAFYLWNNGRADLHGQVYEACRACGAQAEYQMRADHHSDEISFVKTPVPAITLLSKNWLKDNHTPQDTVTRLDTGMVSTAADVLFTLVKQLAT